MEQQGFLNLKDMFDGGGAGAYGDRFEGGGLLSDVANALFQPLGYRDRMRGMQETRPMARPMAMTQPAPMAAPAPAPMGSGMTPANNYVGPPAPPQMGSGMTPANAYVPMGRLSFEQFVAGLGPVAQTASPMALRQAYDQFLMGY